MLRKGESHDPLSIISHAFLEQSKEEIKLSTNSSFKKKKKKMLPNMEKKTRYNSLEFTVLRHKINVLAPFYSSKQLSSSVLHACSMT